MKKSGFFYIFVILSLMIMFLFSGCQKKTATGPGKIAGEVSFVIGEVLMNNKQIAEGDSVPDTSVIITGPGSECEIIFNEKNIIHIAENSAATLDFSGAVKQVNLDKGTISSILKKIEWVVNPESDAFRIKTNIAVLGVRGTSFFIHADNERTYICDCNGVVYLEDETGNSREIITATHHEARVFTRENGKVLSNPGKMEFHTDADIEKLGSKIGYIIDWTVAD